MIYHYVLTEAIGGAECCALCRRHPVRVVAGPENDSSNLNERVFRINDPELWDCVVARVLRNRRDGTQALSLLKEVERVCEEMDFGLPADFRNRVMLAILRLNATITRGGGLLEPSPIVPVDVDAQV